MKQFWLVFLFAVGTNLSVLNAATISEIRTKDIETLCMAAKTMMCLPECFDGFGEDCYFDAKTFPDADSQGFSLGDKKEICFAVHTQRSCGKCVNKFEVRKDNTFSEVSCEDMMRAIKAKDRDCNGCLDQISAGCC